MVINMADIALVKCGSYEAETVRSAVKEALDAIGGIEKYVKAGQKVLIKPNLLAKRKPADCTVTHPAVVEAVVLEVQRVGGIATIADSPGGLYNAGVLKGLYDGTGMAEVAARTGAKLNFDTAYEQVQFIQGRTVKAFDIIKPIIDADVIINVSKLKTHVMSYMTGAVKNMFGSIPGALKAEYHFRMSDKKVFSDMLVDLCLCTKPTLSVMDAVEGMEGNGPSAGEVRHIGAILAGVNPFALDIAAAAIIGMKPNEVFTIVNSIERGLAPSSLDSVEIYGDIKEFVVEGFKKPTARDVHFAAGTPMKALLDFMVNPKPKVIVAKCTGCGECARVCPAKVIDMKSGRPDIDLTKCIRCFCCHELCPSKAMDLHRPFVFRMFLKYFM